MKTRRPKNGDRVVRIANGAPLRVVDTTGDLLFTAENSIERWQFAYNMEDIFWRREKPEEATRTHAEPKS